MSFEGQGRDFYAGRRVLVAGGDGFIGGNCVRMLVEQGANVTLMSRSSPRATVPPGVRVIVGDLTDLGFVLAAVPGHHVVFDCAGGSGAVESNSDVFSNFDLECRPHLNLFDACARQVSPPVIVFLSTRLVYGKPTSLPVCEEHPLRPESIYAVHKIALENYLRVLHRTRGMPYCVLRVSNPYGPSGTAEAKSYGIINQFIRAASLGLPIKIFGDGSQQRDYIYIDDLVDVMLTVATTGDCHSETFNVGSGIPLSIRDALECIQDVVGRKVFVDFVEWPPAALLVETGGYVSDLSKLRSKLPLPPFVLFETGVARTLALSSFGATPLTPPVPL